MDWKTLGLGALNPAAAIGTIAPIAGGLISDRSARKQQERSIELQKEFAQHGIQWRVEDAKAAGLHPLFALGASTSGPTIPIMESGLGRGLSEAGQSVANAVRPTQSPTQRGVQDLQLEILGLQRDKAGYEAAAARAEAEKALRQGNARPGMPPVTEPDPRQVFQVMGQSMAGNPGESGNVQFSPSQADSRAWWNPAYEAASTPLMKLFESSPGRFTALPSKQAQEAMESFENPLMMLWFINESIRNDPEWAKHTGMPFMRDWWDLSEKIYEGRQAWADIERGMIEREKFKRRREAGDDYRWGGIRAPKFYF